MSNKVHLLVSGPGLIGKSHARLIQSRPDCVLAGLVGPAAQENLAFAEACGTTLHPDLDTAFGAGPVDAVIISSPNAVHFEQAMQCLSRNVPALVEKPITANLVDALHLVEESERRGIPLLVGHHRTYSPLLDVARSLLRSESFGALVAVQASALFYKPAHYFLEGAWRVKKGGGPILINLIHEIGLMRHLCGEITGVYALASNHVRRFEVEDTVAITFQFASGALGTFLLSDTAASDKSWEMTSGENPAYPHAPDQNCYHFAGTRGSLDFPTMKVRHYGGAPSWWTPFEHDQLTFTRQDPLALQLAHFIDVVTHKTPPKVSARDGYMNMLVVEAISQSIERGSLVELPSLQARANP